MECTWRLDSNYNFQTTILRIDEITVLLIQITYCVNGVCTYSSCLCMRMFVCCVSAFMCVCTHVTFKH